MPLTEQSPLTATNLILSRYINPHFLGHCKMTVQTNCCYDARHGEKFPGKKTGRTICSPCVQSFAHNISFISDLTANPVHSSHHFVF